MANTPNLKLPLLSPSQAQKHVTVNEALTLLDMATNSSIESANLSTPPAAPLDGQAFVVASSATDDWEGHDGKIALFSNGGWLFAQPEIGWKAFDRSAGKTTCFDGTGWVGGAQSVSTGGAGFGMAVAEIDHVITAGGSNLTAPIIPSHTSVIGVSARIIGTLTGGLNTWRLGVAGSDNRYGAGFGLDLNSYVKGLTGSPITYWGDTELLLTSEGGNFGTGQIRLAVHYMEITPPRAV